MTAPVRPSVLQENRLRRDFANLADGRPPTSMWLRMDLEASDPVSAGELAAAMTRVVGRHDALRTRFTVRDGAPAGEVLAPERLDLTPRPGRPEDDPEPFDVTAAPLVRTYLDGGPGGSRRFSVRCDHRVCDLMSLDLLHLDLAAELADPAGAPREPAPSYHAWAARQREALDGEEGARLEAYWRSLLGPGGTFPDLALPPGDPTAAPADLHRVDVEPQDSVAVFQAARAARLTPFAVAVHVLAASYCELTGADDAVVHSPVGNRADAAARHTVGWLAHSLPFRVRPADGAEACRDAMLDAIEHQAMPLPLITRRIAPGDVGRTSRPARLYATVVAQQTRRRDAATGLRRLLFHDDMSGPAEPGVSLHLTDDGREHRWELRYPPREVDSAFVAALGDAVRHQIRALSRPTPVPTR